MHSFANKAGWFELEESVDAFEGAQVRDGEADLADFLPPAEHPNRRDILLELIRVDLEYRWQRGEACSSDGYRTRFPELFDDQDAVRQIEFELERLRRRRIDEFPFPEVGDDFLGFRLVGELGHGAFGKVYLARQEGLANRTVALKVSKILFGESHTLAQLQHTNIVPVYSVHVRRPFQAVCMPYLGGTTLADVLRQLRGNASPPDSGLDLLSTLRSGATLGRRTSSIAGEKSNAAKVPSLDEELLGDKQGSRAGDETRSTVSATVASTVDANGATESRAANSGAVRLDVACAPGGPGPAEIDRIPRARLASLGYVEAVLWIAARLADGLNHAHARGVLHRDLKPANILLTDEGQPMLLDFNLSIDAHQTATTARVGGTLPYMSPEQLAALGGNSMAVDPRSDIYSLGVVLYELLSLRHPFPVAAEAFPASAGGTAESSALLRADRRQGPPPLARLNRAVSPAVESIVRHALEADPSCRYRSARELQEDIERHLVHQPLRYAPEPSWTEWTAKWLRRHPRLTSHASVALMGVALLLLAGSAWFLAERRAARADSLEQWRNFETRLPPVLSRLSGTLSMDQSQRDEVLRLGRELVSLYQVEQDARWYDRPAVSKLDDAPRLALHDHLGGLALSMAAATISSGAASEAAKTALEWNMLADRCFLPEERPSLLWTQRAEILRQLGREEEAKAAEVRATRAPTRSAVDHYWRGFERAQRHDYRQAMSALEAAIQDDPRLFWGWFQLGVCNDALLRNERAAQCYTVCLALLPDSGEAYFRRGLARLRDGRCSQALADFDQVVRLLPNRADVYLERGEARSGLNDPAGAAAEFTHALDMGADEARALLGRSRALSLAGDEQGARRDLSAGLAAQPKGADGWVARGLARFPGDPAGALADYDRALEIAPRNLPALQNSAAVLGELPGRTEDAIRMLDRALEICPDFVPARAGRAVLLARVGRRDAALADARESLAHEPQPVTIYQAACTFALVSREDGDGRREALRLLAAALAQGFGREYVGSDHDLDALRGDDEFDRVVGQVTSPSGRP
ncbi:MAG TPA: protein kinase [Pirellulales bacterium]|nr:protein kinase [Pirellulales bacterium]